MGALAWRVLGAGSAMLAATAAEKGLAAGWRYVTGNRPPAQPGDPDTRVGEAVAWAVISGVGVGLARLLATRRAAAYYRRSSGELPKALTSHRDDG
jgi:Protein of unknown function (DUF4235)